MDEFKFVMKCLAFSALLLVLTQIKTNDVSLEHRIQASLINSQTSDFVNKVAMGGVKLIHDGSDSVVRHYNLWKTSGASPVSVRISPAPRPVQPVQAQSRPITEDVEPADDTE